MVIKPIGDSSTAIKYFEPALAGCMLHVTDEQVLHGIESRKKYRLNILKLMISVFVYG